MFLYRHQPFFSAQPTALSHTEVGLRSSVGLCGAGGDAPGGESTDGRSEKAGFGSGPG